VADKRSFAALVLALLPVFIGTFCTSGAANALSTVLGVRLAASEPSALAAGIVLSCHFVGLILGCRMSGRVILAIGHVRAYALFGATTTILILAIGLVHSSIALGALRIGTGLASGGLLVVIESWINRNVESDERGSAFGAYLFSSNVSVVAAPHLITLFDPLRPEIIIVIAMVYAAAPLGIVARLKAADGVGETASLSLRALVALSPLGFFASFAHGLISGGLFQMAPVYFKRVGFDLTALSWFLSLAIAVGAVAQIPVGMLGDRWSRHGVLLLLALLSTAVGAVLAVIPTPTLLWFYILGIIAVSASMPFYGLGAGIANDRARGTSTVGVSGALLMSWAAGAVSGPVVASASIDLFGPHGLFIHVAIGSAILAAVVVWRWIARGSTRAVDKPSAVPPAH
jgi:MFS family permease